jgi:hypothetical protein
MGIHLWGTASSIVAVNEAAQTAHFQAARKEDESPYAYTVSASRRSWKSHFRVRKPRPTQAEDRGVNLSARPHFACDLHLPLRSVRMNRRPTRETYGSTRETLEDLRRFLQRFEESDPAHDDASVAAVQRILRDRIAELESLVAMHDI